MGSVNIDNTGGGGDVTLSSDGTDLLLNGTAIGGGGGGGASALTIDTKSAAYTVVSGDLGKIINFSSGSSADATLPDITTVSSGFHVSIWNTAGTGVSISVKPIVGQQIGTSSGNAFTNTQPFVLRWGAGITLVSDGTYWHIYDAKIYGNYRGTIAIGSNTSATNNLSIAIGNNVTASGVYSTAIGTSTSSTQANANYSTAIGVNSGGDGSVTATGSGAMALGGSRASGVDSFAAAIVNNTSSYGATGANSIAIGDRAKATATHATAIGTSVTASQVDGAVAMGSSSTASGLGAFATGYLNIASGHYSQAIGFGANTQSIYGKFAKSSGFFSNYADMQTGILVLVAATTDDTPKALTSNKAAAGTTNQVILPNNCAYAFHGTIVARQQASAGTACAAWKIEGLIRREGSAGTTVLVNSATTVLDNTPAWGMTLSADTTNGGLAITVTGAAATNIRWVATINTSEVTY